MTPYNGSSPLTYNSQSKSVSMPLTPIDSQQASPSSPLGFWGTSNVTRQPKQIRTPRAPLYVPAVLRPTEKPIKASPPSSRQSANSQTPSVPSLSASAVSSEADSPAIRRMVTEEWLDDSRAKVGGPPSRNHWKPDPSSNSCDSPTCERSFTLLIRRHHCRRCGCIFCAEHSPHTVPLDQHARFHLMAPRYRACDDCYKDYRIWETDRLKKPTQQGSSESFAQTSTLNNSVDIVVPASAAAAPIAHSVPSNWNWSTF